MHREEKDGEREGDGKNVELNEVEGKGRFREDVNGE